MRTLLVVSLLSLAALGCKDKPTKKEPPPNVGSANTGSGGMRPAPDLMLPRADGTPPKKTTAKHTRADYERLAKLEYPGFTREQRSLGDNNVEIRHKTKDFPRLWAVVTIKHCLDCLPMELDKWKAKEQEIKAMNLEGLQDAKDIEWEMGQDELFGQPIIYTYQVGTGEKPSEGGTDYSFTNAYVAYFNDGINEIRVVGTYKDDPLKKDDLKRVAPKADLRALALSFMDVYTHAW